jgi:hypothetical protein
MENVRCFPEMKNVCLLFILISLVFFAAETYPNRSENQVDIQIEAKPIDQFEPSNPGRKLFGSLEFRGGLELTCAYEHFGGFSAMRIQPDGANFIALSDRAFWLRGRIVYKGIHPAGIQSAVMAPVLDGSGKAATRWDTESIADDGEWLYVGIEGINSIMRFDYGKKGLAARAESVSVPSGIKGLPDNKGLEAMVFVPRKLPLGGTLIALSERGLDKSGNLKAFLIGGRKPGRFAVKRTDEYDMSDAALLPNGDLMILERKFFVLQGVFMRIRRIRLGDIRPGALVDGPVLIEANMRNQIDNMEALCVHQGRSGEIILTLMSDDNFSAIQRTVLLQFALVDAKKISKKSDNSPQRRGERRGRRE